MLAEDQPQVLFAADQHPVQAFAAGAADPAFGDRVRTRCPHRGLDDPYADSGEYRVEPDGELSVSVTDQELEDASVILKSMSRLRACWVTHSPVG